MDILSCESLSEVKGGGKTLWFILGGIGVLISGIVAGFVNPYTCKK